MPLRIPNFNPGFACSRSRCPGRRVSEIWPSLSAWTGCRHAAYLPECRGEQRCSRPSTKEGRTASPRSPPVIRTAPGPECIDRTPGGAKAKPGLLTRPTLVAGGRRSPSARQAMGVVKATIRFPCTRSAALKCPAFTGSAAAGSTVSGLDRIATPPSRGIFPSSTTGHCLGISVVATRPGSRAAEARAIGFCGDQANLRGSGPARGDDAHVSGSADDTLASWQLATAFGRSPRCS